MLLFTPQLHLQGQCPDTIRQSKQRRLTISLVYHCFYMGIITVYSDTSFRQKSSKTPLSNKSTWSIVPHCRYGGDGKCSFSELSAQYVFLVKELSAMSPVVAAPHWLALCYCEGGIFGSCCHGYASFDDGREVHSVFSWINQPSKNLLCHSERGNPQRNVSQFLLQKSCIRQEIMMGN